MGRLVESRYSSPEVLHYYEAEVFLCTTVYCMYVLCAVLHARCSVVQCGAVCCSVLQCVAVCCSVLPCLVWAMRRVACTLLHVWCSVLQCVAVCCSVLQCVAVCCSVELACTMLHVWCIWSSHLTHLWMNHFMNKPGSFNSLQYTCVFWIRTLRCVCWCPSVVHMKALHDSSLNESCYGVATISRLLKMITLFCRTSSLLGFGRLLKNIGRFCKRAL